MRKTGFRKRPWEAGVHFLAEVVLLVWVDDSLLVGGRQEDKTTRNVPQVVFTIRDMGPISHILHMRVERNRWLKTHSIDHEDYVNQILRRFHRETEKGVATPMEPGALLLRLLETPTVYLDTGKPTHHFDEEEAEEADQKATRRLSVA